jgi:hypothetical protein
LGTVLFFFETISITVLPLEFQSYIKSMLMENKLNINITVTTEKDHRAPAGEGIMPDPISSAFTTPELRKKHHKLLQNTMAKFENGLKDLGVRKK